MNSFFSYLCSAFFCWSLLSSCQSTKKTEPLNSSSPHLVDVRQQIKDQKKAQAANDLPIRGIDYSATLEKIGFASCLDQTLPVPILKTIAKENLDLFIMMGDNVYASKPETKPISEQYRKLLKNEDFTNLRAKVPMLAIWDDHDYGVNDGGSDNPDKELARKDFLNFWPYVQNTISKKQQALYHSKVIGSTSHEMHFILLDTRWDRSPLVLNPDTSNPLKKYIPNEDKKSHLLSEEQWQWLEKELRRPTRIKVVVSSIQLIAEGHGFEKWGNFPHEKRRFYELLKKTGARNVFVLSGDRHLASFAQTKIKGWGTLYDITSSSLNKGKDFSEEDADYFKPTYGLENYGLLSVDWRKQKVRFDIQDIEGKTQRTFETTFR